jgi:nicotinic acid mononucleotide adenylyltransferase
MKKVALVIGKFDLLHPEHLKVIRAALGSVGGDGILAVMFGGSGKLPSLGLACTYEQRVEVLQTSLTQRSSLEFVPLEFLTSGPILSGGTVWWLECQRSFPLKAGWMTLQA